MMSSEAKLIQIIDFAVTILEAVWIVHLRDTFLSQIYTAICQPTKNIFDVRNRVMFTFNKFVNIDFTVHIYSNLAIGLGDNNDRTKTS